ncbi:hypothetical protein ILUMI_22646 [Ignelater luminosus]|uniref:Uncharacterized protein n=1 Tax=Ignelater luminosus TaxID=2038154 RepID=A0A8K0FXB7_IGNLU|nr:hypothetical protein ILUMI_22646 [Ignelater luminosus]
MNIETRKLIVHEWCTEGLPMRSLAKSTKCSLLTGVRKVICKYGEHNSLNDLKSRGRKRGTSCPRVEEKLKRTIYVNSMWLNAVQPDCVKLQPENYGWFFDGYLKPIGFVGDQTPLRIDDIVKIIDNEKEDEESSELEDIILEDNFTFDDSDNEEN